MKLPASLLVTKSSLVVECAEKAEHRLRRCSELALTGRLLLRFEFLDSCILLAVLGASSEGIFRHELLLNCRISNAHLSRNCFCLLSSNSQKKECLPCSEILAVGFPPNLTKSSFILSNGQLFECKSQLAAVLRLSSCEGTNLLSSCCLNSDCNSEFNCYSSFESAHSFALYLVCFPAIVVHQRYFSLVNSDEKVCSPGGCLKTVQFEPGISKRLPSLALCFGLVKSLIYLIGYSQRLTGLPLATFKRTSIWCLQLEGPSQSIKKTLVVALSLSEQACFQLNWSLTRTNDQCYCSQA